jgi:hypothetical protein
MKNDITDLNRIPEFPCVAAFSCVEDSGERREFTTGSRRDVRSGKGRYDLISPYFIDRLAKHLENGAAKYGDRNWELGQPLSGYIDSAGRHLNKVLAGYTDEDHAMAAAWNIMAWVHTQMMVKAGRLPKDLDDMPEPMPYALHRDEGKAR